MKRIALLSILALAVAAATVASNAVGAGDAAGPKCADITDGIGGYAYYEADNQTPLANPYFELSITVAGPTSAKACGSSEYTLYLSYDGVPQSPLQGTTNGTTTVTFPRQTFTQASAPDHVCAYAESTTNGGHLADRAPDLGCQQYNRGDFGGTLFH
jgi:hypothetical protein